MNQAHAPGVRATLGQLRIPPRGRVRNQPLVGARVQLTPIDPADGPELWDLVEASRPQLVSWLPWVPYNNSLDASQRYAEACAADWDNLRALRLGIRSVPTGDLLGIVSLDNCAHVHRSCDLGYWLTTSATRRGLMTEAARVCLRFAFEQIGLHRVRCAAATSNHRSLGVIARLGFRFEGIAREAEFVDSRWVDHAVFSLLESDTRP
jgi:ribosomal-protein-serine acetyltransferase